MATRNFDRPMFQQQRVWQRHDSLRPASKRGNDAVPRRTAFDVKAEDYLDQGGDDPRVSDVLMRRMLGEPLSPRDIGLANSIIDRQNGDRSEPVFPPQRGRLDEKLAAYDGDDELILQVREQRQRGEPVDQSLEGKANWLIDQWLIERNSADAA